MAKAESGTGSWNTYHMRYKHTYGSGSTAWKVGFTSETIDDYADELGQYAP